MSKLQKVNDDQIKDLLDRGENVIVIFTAKWCAPCRILKPLLEELADKYNGYIFAEYDVDESAQFARDMSIRSVPTLCFFRKGKNVHTSIGSRPRETVISLISTYLD